MGDKNRLKNKKTFFYKTDRFNGWMIALAKLLPKDLIDI